MAGIAKPNVPNLGPESKAYSFLTYNSTGYGWTPNVLVDGLTNGTAASQVLVFGYNYNFLELRVDEPLVIWRCGSVSAPDYFAKFITWKWEDETWLNISNLQPNTSSINNTGWEPITTVLLPGKYRFGRTTDRMDSEWYFEKIVNIKTLIKLNNQIQTIASNTLTLFSAEKQNMFEQLGMNSLIEYNNFITKVAYEMDEVETTTNGRIISQQININDFEINSMEVK